MILDYFQLTEDGSVDDVRVGEADFDGVVLVLDVHDVKRNRLVGEDDVAGVVENHLEGERTLDRGLVLSILALKMDVHPFHDQGGT